MFSLQLSQTSMRIMHSIKKNNGTHRNMNAVLYNGTQNMSSGRQPYSCDQLLCESDTLQHCPHRLYLSLTWSCLCRCQHQVGERGIEQRTNGARSNVKVILEVLALLYVLTCRRSRKPDDDTDHREYVALVDDLAPMFKGAITYRQHNTKYSRSLTTIESSFRVQAVEDGIVTAAIAHAGALTTVSTIPITLLETNVPIGRDGEATRSVYHVEQNMQCNTLTRIIVTVNIRAEEILPQCC